MAAATCIALLRGINVGRSRRIAMAELRALFEELGFAHVQTVLNSGNVVFDAAPAGPHRLAARIEEGIRAHLGFEVPVIAVAAERLDVIVAQNTLAGAQAEASKLLVAFVSGEAVLDRVRPLLGQSWAGEALAVGRHAAYLHCPGGIVESGLLRAFSRATGDAATTRNWATVLKLQQAAARARHNAH